MSTLNNVFTIQTKICNIFKINTILVEEILFKKILHEFIILHYY